MSLRRRALALTLLTAGLLVGSGASPASAHPLGNATVNHYDGLTMYPDRIVDRAVEDIAEIPTFQRKGDVDRDGDGAITSEEASAYAVRQCADMARTVDLRVDSTRLSLSVGRSSYAQRPGAGGLKNGRLECELSAPTRLQQDSTVSIDSVWDDDGIGWHEITAVGVDVSLVKSPFPAATISKELRAYPNDLLSSPLDVRRGTVQVRPGGGGSTYDAVRRLPVAGPAAQALASLSRTFNNKVGAKDLTVGVGLLALLLAVTLGAGHAFLPGHGKTIMAAYLVGRRGSLRDVVTVGATVTITHTAGVLLLGLAITSTTAFAPATAEKYLGVLSGGIVALVGVGLLVTALRRRTTPVLSTALRRDPVAVGAPRGDHDHAHEGHGHDHDHDHGHDHGHDHDHGHKHGLFGRGHSHGPEPAFGKGGLIGLGVAGGLVPSPSALLVLLAATALGRTWFGISLVLGYGLGMAVALSVAGLLLVRLRGSLDRFAATQALARMDRLVAVMPILTALLVLAVGSGLALRALGGKV